MREADALIADAQGIADYYDDEFGVPTELMSYGCRVLTDVPTTGLAQHGLVPGGYHLVVARFEPENHVAEIVEGYHRSRATLPLVVVGSAPYSAGYTSGISAVAEFDQRIRLLGGVWDQDVLDQLYAHAASYVHGHPVGGTYVPLAQLAASPDLLAVGAITRSTSGAAIGFAVAWPDGSTGTFTGTESTTTPGAIDAYTVTKTKGGTTVTFTQPQSTRDASGGVTNRPAITAA